MFLPLVLAAALSGEAGVCVKLDDTGKVVDARIVESSGDATIDSAALQAAVQVHWDAPYPKPGWVGLRIGIGAGARSDRSRPSCDAATT